MGGNRRDGLKEAHWRGHVEAQRSSGLSARVYCAAHDLRESAFYLWKRTIRERDAEGVAAAESGRAAFAEMVVREAPSTASAGGAQPASAGLRVEFACGARVHLDRGFDAETFARAVRALLDAERC